MAVLSTEQLLLLNNLMYMTSDHPFSEITAYNDGRSVGDIVASIDIDSIKVGETYGSYMTGEDWINIINAIKADDTLMNVQLVSTNVDDSLAGSGGGVSALFVTESNEAVVTFRGTALNEWRDDFTAGAAVSSAQQENALAWYQSLDLDDYDSITVTGHSKGGNKAKYITILDNSVDRCVSFDGQGFSDEFMEEYANRIALNEGKIENHNVDCDYVNILLNDIGTTTYYESQDIGNPLEFHCPNSFFDFGEGGSVTLHETEQNPIMQKIDQALNSILRMLSDDEKEQFLDTFGEIFQVAMGGSGRSIVTILSDVSDMKLLAYILLLLGLYVECNLLDASVVGYVLSYFDIDLTVWIPDGSDIQVSSLNVGAEIAFAVNPAIVLQIEEELVNQNAKLEGYAERVEKVGKNLKGIYLTLGWAVSSQANKISKYGTVCTKMADALDSVTEQYQKTEQLCMIEQ